MVEGLGVGWNCAEKANDLPCGRSEHAQWEAGVLQDEYYEQTRIGGSDRIHGFSIVSLGTVRASHERVPCPHPRSDGCRHGSFTRSTCGDDESRKSTVSMR